MSRAIVIEFASLGRVPLLVFPVVPGAGERLFPDGTVPIDLTLESTRANGQAVRIIYTRTGGQ